MLLVFPLGKVAPPCIALILLVLHSIFPDPSIEFSDNHWDPSTPSGKKTFTRIVQYLHHCAKWVHRSIQVLAMLCRPFLFRHRFNWAPLSEEKLVHYVLKVEQGWTLYNICATLYLTYGGPVEPLWSHRKWSRGVSGAPQNGHFWPYLAIWGHRLPQLTQMGWILVEQDWTLYLTYGGTSLTPLDPSKMVPGISGGSQKRPFLAIFGNIWS